MKLRARLLLMTGLLVAAVVGIATWTVAVLARRAFERADERRAAALVDDFRRELERSGEELVDRAERIAASESIQRMALDVTRPERDFSVYVNEAAALAAEHRLDFVDLAAADGTLLSSAEWPARFGYGEEWLVRAASWSGTPAFFRRMELAAGPELGLVAVRAAAVGDRKLFVVVGRKVDAAFFGSLGLPEGMRVLLYQPDSFRPEDAAVLGPLIERVRLDRREVAATIDGPQGTETFLAGPLEGRENELLGVLLVGSSRRELQALVRRMRWAGVLVAAAGIAAGVLASYWLASNLTRPVERLAAAARRVASGDWETRVEKRSTDEVGDLVGAFNTMTRQLVEQRDRLVQTERVAAWRELARRLAHELKNPLFPLQITVENLARARERDPAQFDEVFRESTSTLLAEIANLKDIVGRFSDFARMPPPELAPVDLNEVVRGTLRLVGARLRAPGCPQIRAETSLDETVGAIQADAGQIGRALQNLVLNAIDAMPSGGTLSIRTRRDDGAVHVEVSDTGEGLTPEECERLFTPYYTTKHHGTGLGLAIVQSVVSDHQGRISVTSEPGRGTTFRIDLPGAAA